MSTAQQYRFVYITLDKIEEINILSVQKLKYIIIVKAIETNHVSPLEGHTTLLAVRGALALLRLLRLLLVLLLFAPKREDEAAAETGRAADARGAGAQEVVNSLQDTQVEGGRRGRRALGLGLGLVLVAILDPYKTFISPVQLQSSIQRMTYHAIDLRHSTPNVPSTVTVSRRVPEGTTQKALLLHDRLSLPLSSI